MHIDRCGNNRGRNVTQRGEERKIKCKNLCTGIKRMWNTKCVVIPLITGATGMVTEGLKDNLEAIQGKHSVDSVQKTAVLGTSNIIRKVLQSGTGSLSDGDHCWFERSTRGKRPVTGENNNNNNIIIITNYMQHSALRRSHLQ